MWHWDSFVHQQKEGILLLLLLYGDIASKEGYRLQLCKHTNFTPGSFKILVNVPQPLDPDQQ